MFGPGRTFEDIVSGRFFLLLSAVERCGFPHIRSCVVSRSFPIDSASRAAIPDHLAGNGSARRAVTFVRTSPPDGLNLRIVFFYYPSSPPFSLFLPPPSPLLPTPSGIVVAVVIVFVARWREQRRHGVEQVDSGTVAREDDPVDVVSREGNPDPHRPAKAIPNLVSRGLHIRMAGGTIRYLGRGEGGKSSYIKFIWH